MSQASIFARIGGKLVEVIDIEKQVELDTYYKCNFTILADSVDLFSVRNSSFAVFVDNKLFASGVILQRPSIDVVEGKNVLRISGISDLGRLSCERAFSLGYYQNELITTILASLLSTSIVPFTLDASNFADALTATTTIDLRQKESLFGQISEVIKSYPNLHIRENISSGNLVLEIGEFGRKIHSVNQGVDLLSISLQADDSRIYSSVESYGGLSPTVRISLNDSIADGRALASPFYAQFPIVVDGNGLAYVVNTALPPNCSIVKDFQLHKTDNEKAVTQAEKDDAAFALYEKSVRFLQQHQGGEDYDISLITDLETLTIGDRIHVTSIVEEEYFNQEKNVFESVEVFSVNTDYRITNINTQLENYSFSHDNGVEIGHQYVYDIRVTSAEDTANYDEDTELYERLDKVSETPSLEALQVAPPQQFSITFDESIDAADCVTNGFNGKEYIFDVATTAPVWATGKNVIVSSTTPFGAIYEITQYNPSDLTDFIICVRGLLPNENWGAGGVLGEITVTIVVIYT